jgi:hypothetical protein
MHDDFNKTSSYPYHNNEMILSTLVLSTEILSTVILDNDDFNAICLVTNSYPHHTSEIIMAAALHMCDTESCATEY